VKCGWVKFKWEIVKCSWVKFKWEEVKCSWVKFYMERSEVSTSVVKVLVTGCLSLLEDI